ncbi:MAG TPA: hypothetical protein VEG29_06485, partial [Candidatus Binatia bacterium]|nr:hypothetical protein [Candidatus Binatia bacterium]
APRTIQLGPGVTGTVLEGTLKAGAVANDGDSVNLFCTADNPYCDFSNGGELGIGLGQRFELVVATVAGSPVVIEVSSDDASWDSQKASLEALLSSITFPKSGS